MMNLPTLNELQELYLFLTPLERDELDNLTATAELNADSWKLLVQTKTPHTKQAEFVDCEAKRIVVKSGRRSGKTTGVVIRAVRRFLAGRRVLYAAPTADQLDAFWYEVKAALQLAITAKYLYVNETEHVIEVPGTKNRIRAKTAFNADTLRGDYADDLILDEYQLMDETAWSEVGAPMMLDTDGIAMFVFTPPSIRSRSMSKAKNKKHAVEFFKKAQADTSGRWAAFHFSSKDNPHLSQTALEEITADMTRAAYKQEILAEDDGDVEGALWKLVDIDTARFNVAPPLHRIVIAIDPAATANANSDETGIVAAGAAYIDGVLHGFVLGDYTLKDTPNKWASAAVDAYYDLQADCIIGEVNNGGDMVGYTVSTVDSSVPFTAIRASRGKATRADPIAAFYEQGRVHHVGIFPELEDQQVSWIPGVGDSPDRVDAMVWALSEVMLGDTEMRVGTLPPDVANWRGS